jgi:LPXTG-motif cell wall-anchored protein
MSYVRRLALGLPAAGATAFAALTVASPALAADTVQAGNPVVMASPDRGHAGYGAESPAATSPAAISPAATTAAATTSPAAVAAASATPTGATRGHAGYGTPSPTASLPIGSVKSVPSGGVNSATAPSPTKGGVSSGALPLTGGPVAATVGVGAVLVAGGAGALWYTRRRKNA